MICLTTGRLIDNRDVGYIVIGTTVPEEVQERWNETLCRLTTAAMSIARTLNYTDRLEIHHIVARKSLRFDFAHQSRVILSKSGYYKRGALDNADVDHPDNLCPINYAMHRRLHTVQYHIFVYSYLNSVFDETRSELVNHVAVQGALDSIKELLWAQQDMFPGDIYIVC